MPTKILLICIDALSATDHEMVSSLPNLGPLASRGAVVRRMLPVFPSLTYPGHTSIITGRNVVGHGVFHNEDLLAGQVDRPWFNQYSMVTAQSLVDVAAAAGRSTGAISWPVTGGAPWDYVLPMIVPYEYTGWQPEQYLQGNATESLLDEYMWRYGYHLMGEGRSLDAFTMAVTPDILRDHGQPDVLLVKLCDLDSARHKYGLRSPQAIEELRRHDQQVGVLLEAVRRWGDLEHTVVAITGDHGIQDVSGALRMNVLLRDAGFIDVADDDTVTSWRAWCHSSGQSGWIQCADESTREAVEALIREIVASVRYGVIEYLTASEALEQYGLVGPFDFVLNSQPDVSFQSSWQGSEVYVPVDDANFTGHRGNHGGLPSFVPSYALFSGAGVAAGVQIDEARLIDIAPTLARLAGLDLVEVDGRVLEESVAGAN